MKIVLDTNVLISGIFWGGTPYKIVECIATDQIQVVVTKNILKEYFEVLNRMNPTMEIAKKWQLLLMEKVLITEEVQTVRFSRDSNDDMFVSCALSADTNYIVSGDKDLLTLKTVSNTKIVTPAQFLKIFR